jgi:hypothetical protein
MGRIVLGPPGCGVRRSFAALPGARRTGRAGGVARSRAAPCSEDAAGAAHSTALARSASDRWAGDASWVASTSNFWTHIGAMNRKCVNCWKSVQAFGGSWKASTSDFGRPFGPRTCQSSAFTRSGKMTPHPDRLKAELWRERFTESAAVLGCESCIHPGGAQRSACPTGDDRARQEPCHAPVHGERARRTPNPPEARATGAS